jgi:hypothetical protein
VGGFPLYPIDYGSAWAWSLIPSPLPHQRSLQFAFSPPGGEGNGVNSFIFWITRELGRAYWPVVHHPRREKRELPVPDHVPFWFQPDSILGWSLITTLIGTSRGLTLSRSAGSRPR